MRLETKEGNVKRYGTLSRGYGRVSSRWDIEQRRKNRPDTSRLGPVHDQMLNPNTRLYGRRTILPPKEIHRVRTVLLKLSPALVATRYGVDLAYIQKIRWGLLPVSYRHWLGRFKRHALVLPSVVHCKKALGQTPEEFARVVNHFLSSEYDIALRMLGREG